METRNFRGFLSCKYCGQRMATIEPQKATFESHGDYGRSNIRLEGYQTPKPIPELSRRCPSPNSPDGEHHASGMIT